MAVQIQMYIYVVGWFVRFVDGLAITSIHQVAFIANNESATVCYLSQRVPCLICFFNGPHYERIAHYNNNRRQDTVDGDIHPG